jgi:hypothetical protein
MNTPETDKSHEKLKMCGYGGVVELIVSRDLERRLTVAREALKVVLDASSNTRLTRVAREALTATAPKS